jgi:hypothetical protein
MQLQTLIFAVSSSCGMLRRELAARRQSTSVARGPNGEEVLIQAPANRRLKNIVVAGTLGAFAYLIYRRTIAMISQNDFGNLDAKGMPIDAPNVHAASATYDAEEALQKSKK